MRETWSVDGYSITQGTVRDVELRTGLYGTPEAVGANAVVPGRTGEVWRPKKHGPGRFTLNIWLAGTTSRGEVEAYWDDLIRAASQPHRLCKWRRTRATGVAQYAFGEVVGGMAPVPVGQFGMRCAVEVKVPAGYWLSEAEQSESSTTGSGATREVALTAFSAATAPLELLTSTVTGPASDPTVLDITDEDVDGAGIGSWWKYTGTFTAGQQLVVNSATWEVTGVGFTADPARITHNDGRFLRVAAARPGQTPRVRFTASNTGSGTGVTLSGPTAWQA